MATLKEIRKLRTKKGSNFYGSKIAKGALRKRMGGKSTISELKRDISKFKNIKNKSAREVKDERQDVFALNAKEGKFRRRKKK